MAQTEIQSQKQLQQGKTADLPDLEMLSDRIWQVSQAHQDDAESLLQILRVLEALHKRIRDDLFQPALPISRHELFNLLRDIETNGGWPHIYRMKINEICRYLEQPEKLEE